MSILGQIRSRPLLIMGIIALGLLAFLVNPESLEKMFGKDPNIFGKVNGEKITREEYNDQLFILQQQAEQQGRPTSGLEEQAWQMLVRSKLVKQQFEKMGLELTDEMFWNQLQYEPMFAQNPENFDEKGNFKTQNIKKQIETLQNATDMESRNLYQNWLKTKKMIEYGIMARQVFANISNGVTVSNKEVDELVKQRDQLADIDFVKVDYASYLQKNPVKVTTQDLADYIKKHPIAFKAKASRNLGLVYFPAVPTAQDDANALKEINKLFSQGTDASGGTENFQNTTNDSMFVMLNSDLPFNSGYFKPNQLPQSISAQIASAAVGQTFGPYKEQNYYIVSKLLGKKTSDSTLSRHILIAHKDGATGQGIKRTKEEAKKLADSIGNAIKANPAKFEEYVKLSNDPGSATQGGSLGWTTPETPFVPEFLAYLNNNPKGATGVVETQFGYHIINIQDKKVGAMAYKVANLAKAIKPSDKTEAELDKQARRFIQQSEGKSFNDFTNLAKKSNYQFSNPKSIGRFDGALQGIGSTADEEVITWAFDKKREKGDTELFPIEGTGGFIVAYFNGQQDEGLADPEMVREQIEPIVKNQLAGKQIAEKIKNAKVTNLDQVAKLFVQTKQSAQVNMLSPLVEGSMEPKVAGAAFGVAKGKLSNPVEGMTGVYVLLKKSETINKQPGDAKQIKEAITAQNKQMLGQMLLQSLINQADIEDYRIEVWNKVPQQ